jgi:hypothetical protein
MPMAWQDYYSAALWLSVARRLPSQVTKELFISEAAPRAASEVTTLSPRDTGTSKPVHD